MLKHAEELGIVIELLYAGMTSIMQPCDIWLNKAVKVYIKRLYYEYKNSLQLKTGDKVSVPREIMVKWVEEALQNCNDKQKRSRAIAAVFAQCGLSPFDMDKSQFCAHLESISEDSIYNALIQNQECAELCYTHH